ncbi:hypothetical protein CK203_108466 [Vitis vinifera]|uniref:Uncharacterized protein n=1 Tax=Vitis vinifera TaxID=29760 RepID=A0A438E8X7_VITVI|nr:hypothetical protein CK203_108466 [Vitis vinifera]
MTACCMTTLSLALLRDGRAFTIRKPPGNARKCMCGGDDHLAWKHPVSLEACRGLRTAGGLTRASDQLDRRSDQGDMDSQIVTVDQFAAAMASIQEAIASLGQRIDGQQAQQTEVAPPPAIVPTPISEDPHARMDKLEQKLRQMRTSEGGITWEDFDGAPVASLPAKFRMPEIERYTGMGCPRIHLDSIVLL